MIGRFTTIDKFAEKYKTHTPYHYGANNPILNIDIHGDSIIVGQNGNDYTVRVTGKVVNDSSTPYTQEQMQDAMTRINSAITNYYSVKEGDESSTATTQLSVASKDNAIVAGDHVIRIVDPGQIPDGFGGKSASNTIGMSPPGQNVIYISSATLSGKPAESGTYANTGLSNTGGPTLERTVGHELLHNGGVTFNGQIHPGKNQMPGNLLNPTGAPGAGSRVTIDQIKQMKDAFDKGRLNYGKQKIL